jgi:hypothetical protein
MWDSVHDGKLKAKYEIVVIPVLRAPGWLGLGVLWELAPF